MMESFFGREKIVVFESSTLDIVSEVALMPSVEDLSCCTSVVVASFFKNECIVVMQ